MPIIKSIGRKDTNFKQLIDYLHRKDGEEQELFTYLHNISSVSPDDIKGMEQVFVNNNQYRKKRKNGIGQYHEVMSFHPEDTTILKKYPEILEDFAQVYLELRAPDSLAIARVHTDKDHIHLHFMISPNEVDSSKSIRLTKKQFQALRRTVEEYQVAYYPELKKSYAQSRNKQKDRVQENEKTEKEKSGRRNHTVQQMKKRGVMLSDKKDIGTTVEAFLDSTNDLETFQNALKGHNVDTYYYKGRLQGVVYNGRKYRFSRLLDKGAKPMEQIELWNQKIKNKNRQYEQDSGLEL